VFNPTIIKLSYLRLWRIRVNKIIRRSGDRQRKGDFIFRLIKAWERLPRAERLKLRDYISIAITFNLIGRI